MARRMRLLALLILACPWTLQAAGAPPDRGGLVLGLSVETLDLDYYRRADDTRSAGTLTNGDHLRPFLRAQSPYRWDRDRRRAFYLEFGLGDLRLDQQRLGAETRDLGTRARGRYAYLAPTGVWRLWGRPEARPGWLVLAGLGLGLGYLEARGDMILTEDGSGERITFDERGAALAVVVLLELRHGPWVLRAAGGGPDLERSLGDSLTLFDFGLDLGLRIRY